MTDIVFSGSSCQTLAKEVADELDSELGRLTIRRFPDGEKYVRIESDVKGKDCTVLQSICAPQDSHFFELLAILETLKEMGSREVMTVVPYYGYGRQDRSFEAGEAVSSRMIAKHIQLHSDAFLTVNIHKETILNFFQIPSQNLDASQELVEYFKTYEMEAPLVIAPDAGAISLAENVARGLHCPYDYLEKKRLAPGKVEMRPKNLDATGKNIILVDDIIDSGNTILEALRTLRLQEARDLFIGCIHPVLTGNVVSRLFATGAVDVVATNTIPSQISFITVSSLIAGALQEGEGK
jgi:ribose-phosphate pyrophosphokinase